MTRWFILLQTINSELITLKIFLQKLS
jgi:hypothetical protein